MHIHGSAHVHGPQAINAPHYSAPATRATGPAQSMGQIDQLDISPEASFVSQARDLPAIRHERVAAIKAQIEAGTYETADKLAGALDALLDELA